MPHLKDMWYLLLFAFDTWQSLCFFESEKRQLMFMLIANVWQAPRVAGYVSLQVNLTFHHNFRTLSKGKGSELAFHLGQSDSHQVTNSMTHPWIYAVLDFELRMTIEITARMKIIFREVIVIWIWESKPAFVLFFLRHLLLLPKLWPFILRNGRDGIPGLSINHPSTHPSTNSPIHPPSHSPHLEKSPRAATKTQCSQK